MDVLVLIALILAVAVTVVRLAASAPLFATLGVCFDNWAEESRDPHSN